MDSNVYRLAKLLIRGRKVEGVSRIEYVAFTKEDILNCDYFKEVIRPMKYVATRKNYIAEQLASKAGCLQKRLRRNPESKEEDFVYARLEIEKEIQKFLRSYPQLYAKNTRSVK